MSQPPAAFSRTSCVVAALLAASLFSACSPTTSRTAQITPTPPMLYEWSEDESGDPVSIRINLEEQKGRIYRGDREVGWTVLATGTTRHPTPTGTFHVMEKIPDKVSNIYGVLVNGAGEIVNGDAQSGVTPVPAGCRFVGAPMPYWMRITGYGVGMHAGDIPDPGRPASHGCIRLPRDFAGTLYEAVSVGTPVIITGP